MPNNPDDRLKPKDGLEIMRPEIYTIIDGKKFPRPGLETVFAEPEDYQPPKNKTTEVVGGSYCSCNKVCSCVPVRAQRPQCGCVGHSGCSCVGHSQGGGVVTGCRCAPVH
jgi:hypothetical protein